MSEIENIRAISRRGILEVLTVLEKNGKTRFSQLDDMIHGLCLGSLTNALKVAKDMNLIEKRSYVITGDGLKEITDEEIKKGVKPQASFYKIKNKGRTVLELTRQLGTVLGAPSADRTPT